MRHQRALVTVVVAAVVAALVPALALAAIGRTSAATVPPARLGNALVDPKLVTQLAQAKAGDQLLVYVHADDIATARDVARGAHLGLVDSFDRIGVAVVSGTPARIRAAGTQPGVRYLQYAGTPMSLNLDHSNHATRGDEARTAYQHVNKNTTTAAAACHKLDKRGNCKDKHPAPPTVTPFEPVFAGNIDGSGVSIAIVDSGIDGTHPFFQRTKADGTTESKVKVNLKLACDDAPSGITASNCTNDLGDNPWVPVPGNDSDTPSAGGHGTHVAGIAGGVDTVLSDGTKMHGAAPDADLIGLSVGQTLSIYGGDAGLNWVLDHHEDPCGGHACPPIRVVNNSWGPGCGGEFNAADATSKLQDDLVAAGVVVVWAAGNDGTTAQCSDPNQNVLNPPAQSPTLGVIGVANYNDGDTGTREGALDPSSSHGDPTRPETFPDISAPGAHILSSCRSYLAICSSGLDSHENGDYNSISGTSMATPHIAGIVAQLLEAKPSLTPAEIEKALEDTAHKFGDAASYVPDKASDGTMRSSTTTSVDKGHGLVDVVAALGVVFGVDAPPAAATCTADGPVVVDASGDATGSLVPGVAGTSSQDALDITEGRLAWDATATAVTFTAKIKDLATAPATNNGIRYGFTYDGQTLFLTANRGADRASDTFDMGNVTTISNTIISDLHGSFDIAADTVSVTVDNSDIARYNTAKAAHRDPGVQALPDITPFEASDLISGFAWNSYQQIDAVAVSYNPTIDSAGGQCPYTLGLGAVPPPAGGGGTPPPPAPDPEPDATLTPSDADGYTWSDGPSVDFQDAGAILGGCDLVWSCQTKALKLEVPAGGAVLSVDVNPDGPQVLSGYSITVKGPGGAALFSGPQTYVGLLVTTPGIYQVTVDPSTEAGTWSATAKLSPLPTLTVDAALSVGGPAFTASGSPAMPTADHRCTSPTDPVCFSYVVDLGGAPAGSKLSVTLGAANHPVDDYDLYVLDQYGREVANSAGEGTAESIAIALPAGVYRIVVQPYNTSGPLGTFDLSASLV